MSSLLEFFAVLIVTEAAIIALSTIPFLQTIISNANFDPTQVWSGVAMIMLVLYTMAFALTWRGK